MSQTHPENRASVKHINETTRTFLEGDRRIIAHIDGRKVDMSMAQAQGIAVNMIDHQRWRFCYRCDQLDRIESPPYDDVFTAWWEGALYLQATERHAQGDAARLTMLESRGIRIIQEFGCFQVWHKGVPIPPIYDTVSDAIAGAERFLDHCPAPAADRGQHIPEHTIRSMTAAEWLDSRHASHEALTTPPAQRIQKLKRQIADNVVVVTPFGLKFFAAYPLTGWSATYASEVEAWEGRLCLSQTRSFWVSILGWGISLRPFAKSGRR